MTFVTQLHVTELQSSRAVLRQIIGGSGREIKRDHRSVCAFIPLNPASASRIRVLALCLPRESQSRHRASVPAFSRGTALAQCWDDLDNEVEEGGRVHELAAIIPSAA
jgi:hypothetical protein